MQKDVIEGYRLSPQQERLWLLDHANGYNPYRAHCAVLLDGPLDRKTLEVALKSLVEQYEILRTSFQYLPGMGVPLQIISDDVTPSLSCVDLTEQDNTLQQSAVEELFCKAGEEPFDLQQKCLLRASLCILAADRHVLLLALPALCADAATLRKLVSELFTAYADPAGRIDAPAKSLQYADISEALNELLIAEETEEARAFWRNFKPQVPSNTDFPFELCRSSENGFEPRWTSIALSSETVDEIISVCRQQESAVEDFLLACWQVLISRLTGDREPFIGLATDGRGDDDFAATVGPLTKYLPLRCNLRGELRFSEMLRNLAATRSELYKWQEGFSFEQVWHTSESEFGPDFPFFPLGFEFEAEDAGGQSNGVSFKLINQYVCSDRFKLKLRGVRRSGALFAELHYDSGLFSEAHIQRLAERFGKLVRSAAKSPELVVRKLKIVGKTERQELIHEWNRTKTEYDSGQCVHELFEAQVEKSASEVALKFGEHELTFHELNGHANQLARHLQAMGVGPDTRVGIVMERCIEMVVGILAILKAGGAYLPLDPANPSNRLSFMLDDADVALILTQQSHAHNSPALHQHPLLCLDGDWDSFSDQSIANPSSTVQPDNLAYIIYTSGSTGTPKGVMIPHRGVVNYLSWCRDAYRVAGGEGAPVHSSIGFDLTVTSLFAPLVIGRKVELLRSEQEIEALAESLRSNQDYSLIKITPAHLEVLSRWLGAEEAAGATRAIIIGGEALRSENLRFWREHAPLTRLINEYGPTETVVGCCVYEVKPDDAQCGPVPIGKPIANTRLYILDEEMQIVPIGVSGELYIGGEGVGRGYVKRADLTAERFVPDPFSEAGGERLYRTGDLARHLPDGEMEYLGRLDKQVKVRGYRIELGEIEEVLTQHPAVGQAIVVTREYTAGDTRLVAYVVPDQERARAVQRLMRMEKDGALNGHSLRELPNGMTIFQQNRGESDYLYREIFEEREYLRHGITLRPGACVFDVGANIGMFSLFVGYQFPGARIYAFEPIPQTCEALRQNMTLHGFDARLFECGVAGEAGEASFTYYPHMSLMSSRFADEVSDRQVIKTFEQNKKRGQPLEGGAPWNDEVLNQVVSDHLAGESVTCRLRTISEVIREHSVERIDLLKVDVERSEWEVLSGIADEDWKKIEQLVIEVHDIEERLQQLCSLLKQRGFRVSVTQEGYLEGTELYVVYALRERPEAAQAKVEPESPVVGSEMNWSSVRRLEGDLRSFLAERLPDYMMPATIVLLDKLPLTPNGKVDALSLPVPAPERPILGTAFELPRTQVEEVVAGIWAEVLKLDHVGVDDNFFELGGHSLLATRVISRLRTVFRLELFMRTLFEKPTVATLANEIEAQLMAGKQLPVMAITKVSREEPLPLSYAQQRLWFVHQFNPRSSAYNVAKIIHLKGELNLAALERTLGEVIARHEVLRTTVAKVHGQLIQIISPITSFTLGVVDLTELEEGERKSEFRRLALEEAELPFELDRGPLIRTTLLKVADDEHALLLTMHHIACDGWTIGVLIKELVALYRAFQSGNATPLEPLSIQYADFAVWQRQWLEGDVLKTLLNYWKQQLADLPLRLKLPTDLPRPPMQTLNGARESLRLGKNISAELKRLSRNEGVTLFMTMLAAFKVLLYRYSGETDIVVGTPIAGRNRAELEPLIGFFINTLVLRTRLSPDLTFRQLLVAVRDTTLDSYAYQDMPFEKLVEELQPDRNPSYSPLFQVTFALQNLSAEALELPGLIVTFLESQRGSSKFDLGLSIEPSEQGLVAAITFNTDLFVSETVARMLDDYASLLDAIVTNPDERLANLLPVIRRKLAAPEALEQGRLFGDIYERSNLTKSQLLIWLGQKLQPEVPLYNITYTFDIEDEVRPDLFARAFQGLVNSSDAMRTIVEEEGGLPRQRVLDDFTPEIEYLDLTQTANPQVELAGWVRQRSQAPINFAERTFDTALIKIADRAFDTALIKIAEHRFVWYLNLHHIVADTWSASLILRSLSEFYELTLRGEQQPRVNLPQFSEYVSHERQWSRSLEFRQAEAYWKRKLDEPVEPITFYGQTGTKPTTRVERIRRELGAERTERLRDLAQRKGVAVASKEATLFNLFAAVLATYLYRVSGQTRLSLGAPFHNRPTESFKNTIGLFMEVLPLRFVVERDETFESLVQKVAAEVRESLHHRHYTIANPPQNKAYDVLLNYHTAAFASFNGARVTTDWVHPGHENDSFALQVYDFALAGNLILDFDLRCDVFNEEQRAQAVRHFFLVLDAMLADVTQPLHRVDILAGQEKERILKEFSSSGEPATTQPCIHQLFEAQAERTPHRPAVVAGDEFISYGELNARSNQLARHLKTCGVSADTTVGICLERSPELMVGILAILKAGGAYVPIDPDYPLERISFMLEDARIPLLLTQRSHVEKLPADQTQVVCLDEERQSILSYDDENLYGEATSNNLAYVIYTSGSTGMPKGVLITHGSAVNHGTAMARHFGLGEGDRVLQFHSISFDAAVEELFPTWFAGAALVLRGSGIVAPGLDFLRLIESLGVTVLNLPTAYWHEWVHELWRTQAGLPDCLRMLIVGGEKASAERYASWQKLPGVSHVRWLNTYGPTETTVSATIFEPESLVPDPDRQTPREISIGRPIAGNEVYLLDAHLLPVPVGAQGELYIGGAGLARGYLNRAELTAERFIPHPFNTRVGARLYRTGDVARFRPDGSIEYAGRVDQQVKVRGYRIELGEIEAVLAQHPLVRESVVAVREDVPGDRRLVAYYLLQPDAKVSTSELRAFLKETLPDYMIPGAFVVLDTIPLTSSGKINHRALPAPNPEQGRVSEEFVAPRTTVELRLALIWEKMLNIRPIGVTDNFFDLGGHSLLVLHVMAQVQREFDQEISLMSFFQSPTIEHLARILSEDGKNLSSSALVPIQPHGSRPPFFCVHSLGGDVLQFYGLAHHLGPDQPFYGLQAPHVSEIGMHYTSVEEMATNYIGVMRSVQPDGPYYIGGYSFGSTIAFEMAQQLVKVNEVVALLALLDGGSPLVTHKVKDRGDAITMAGFARDLARAAGVSLSLPHEEIRLLEPEEGLNYIVEKLRTANLMSPDVELSWTRRFLQGVKTRSRALNDYQPEIYNDVITLFRSSESETESAKAWLEVGVDVRDPGRGWQHLSTKPIEIIRIPGHHVEMTADPNVVVLAGRLRSGIDKAQERSSRLRVGSVRHEPPMAVERNPPFLP